MKKIFNILFYGLKFLLFIAAFGLTLFIFVRMNMRLEKSIVSVLPELIPFAALLVIFVINMLFKQTGITKNLFYNLTCCLVLGTIVFVCYRTIFDTNMVLFYRYGIDYNPAFLSDNLSAIQAMLYMVGGANVVLLLCSLIDKKSSKKEMNRKDIKKEVLAKENVEEEKIKDDNKKDKKVKKEKETDID